MQQISIVIVTIFPQTKKKINFLDNIDIVVFNFLYYNKHIRRFSWFTILHKPVNGKKKLKLLEEIQIR